MISISPDQSKQEASAFAKEIRATFPVIHDPKSVIFDKYHVGGLPANLVIGRNGKIAFGMEGSDTRALEAAVVKALGK